MLTYSAVTIKCNEMLVRWLAAGDWWRGRCLSLLGSSALSTTRLLRSHFSPSTPHCSNHHHPAWTGYKHTASLVSKLILRLYLYSMNLNRNPHNKSRLFSLAASLFHTFCGSKNCFITEGRSLYHLRKVC